MAQTKEGAEKLSAKKIGITVSELRAKKSRGLKWCYGCAKWHKVGHFAKDASRSDGLSAVCRTYRNKAARALYKPKPRPLAGSRRFVAARNDDRKQARRRVNYLVECGVLPKAAVVNCIHCGHIGPGRRHEYHHFKGYSPEFHEVVHVLCSKCHAKERYGK